MMGLEVNLLIDLFRKRKRKREKIWSKKMARFLKILEDLILEKRCSLAQEDSIFPYPGLVFIYNL